MSSKSKSTTDETKHSVLTPTNPDWVTSPVQSLAGKIGDLSNLDPYSLVAGPNALQTQAANSLAGMSSNNAAYGDAQSLFHGLMDRGAAQVTPTLGSALTGVHWRSPVSCMWFNRRVTYPQVSSHFSVQDAFVYPMAAARLGTSSSIIPL